MLNKGENMYQCRKCGKQLTYEAEYCSKCLEEINASKKATSSGEIKPKKQKGRVMDGFGPALTGAILGTVGFSLIMFCLMAADLAVGTRRSFMQVSAWLLWVFGLILTIPSVILGINSIKCFVNAKRKNRKKPIPALIIGIDTVATAAMASLYLLIALAVLTAI